LRHELKDLEDDAGDAITGTALALTDVMAGGAYLTGYQLGVWVRSLVEINKVRVSITLDSCYSGRGLRGDGELSLRTSEDGRADGSRLESDEAADAALEAEEAGFPASDADTLGGESDSGQRNAKVKRSWLSNPEGCTVLTACQLNQKAGEYRFPGEEGKKGILTHWMLDIVSRRSGMRPPTYARVAQHVKSNIKAVMELEPPQTPVLHGDSFYEFLGDQQLVQHPACAVQLLEQQGSLDKLLMVDVGTSQGVAAGAIYSIYPTSWGLPSNVGATSSKAPHSETATMPPKVCIKQAFVFQSSATLLSGGKVPENMAIETGSLAVLDTWSLPSQQRVGLPPLPGTDGDDQLRTAIEELMKETAAIPEFSPCSFLSGNIDSPCNYIVSLDHVARRLEIRNGQGVRVPRVPGISVDGEGAGAKVAHMLKHLARFKALVGLDYGNPPNSLTTSDYSFELLDEDGKVLKLSEGGYDARDNQQVTARFTNKSTTNDVHVAMFMFNATWGVERIYPEDGQPTAQAVAGGERALTCDLTMCIPRVAHPEDPPDIRDLFRAYVYVGDHPPSWDELLLPDIPVHADLVPAGLPVEPVLEEDIGGDDSTSRNRRPPTKRRARNKKPKEQWTVLDFWVHTSPARKPK